MISGEEPLLGNVGGAVRIGSTVRRPTGPWTPAVHALLEYLEPKLRCVPRVHGVDEEGREVLDYLPGTIVDFPAQTLTDGQLHSLARWTKEFHQVVAGFEHPGPWRFSPSTTPSLLGHNDLGPYNVCFHDDELVGVFDWDLAGPSTPMSELVSIAWTSVPLAGTEQPEQLARRLRVVAEGYAGPSAVEILQTTPPLIQARIQAVLTAAAAGDGGIAKLVDLRVPERMGEQLESLSRVSTRVEHLLTHY